MPQTACEIEAKLQLQEPSMAQVIMLNDDYTTMEFVIEILMEVFNKNNAEALKIMLDVHHQGSGLCGIYPYDIAELKVQIAITKSRNNNYPLDFKIQYKE